MAGVSLVVLLFGYSIFYYGLCTVKGNGATFSDVLFPGHYVPGAKPNTTGSLPAGLTHGTTGTTGVDTYGGGSSPGPVYVRGT